MQEALKQAALAVEKGEIPVGAVVVCEDRIIARAHNQVEMLHDPTAHAEMIAITSATEHLGGKLLEGCTMYVTMEPCTMCAGALYWARISNLVFGAADPKRGYRLHGEGLLHPRTQVETGVLAEPSIAMLNAFFSDMRGE
jgi:tRNA(adenine34) deaminase